MVKTSEPDQRRRMHHNDNQLPHQKKICSRIVTIPRATKVQKLKEIICESLNVKHDQMEEAQGHLVVRGKNLDPELRLNQVTWNEWPPIVWAEM